MNFVKIDAWNIIEEGFRPELVEEFESLCSLGNGHQGQRANYEETYTGKTFQGSYIAGVYYPDKTRVGWWKNGYPEYFAKVLNAPNWIGIKIWINKMEFDLAKCKVSDYMRELNMKEGFLKRCFIAELQNGNKIQVDVKRFLSGVDKEIGAIEYFIKAINFDGLFEFEPYIDADVKNKDTNYDEKFWNEIDKGFDNEFAFILSETKKTQFRICTAIKCSLFVNESCKNIDLTEVSKDRYIAYKISTNLLKGDVAIIYKYATNVTSRDHNNDQLVSIAKKNLEYAADKGFAQMKKEQADYWLEMWKNADIKIEGDIAAQQAIRFNIYQLLQTYSGHDSRLNIGPKGFTGEKYGGSTYWDTEAYCLPFYLSSAKQEVAHSLLKYRFDHLEKAIENAKKLGFTNGAALYPMVTMNGEECHNEWEITFQEIHRNGAIAYAIYDYINYTGDYQYIQQYGLEVLIAISRFWAQRVNFSEDKQKYVILGVTGPNEYENNINNNFYTNKLAVWTLKYTLECLKNVENKYSEDYKRIISKTSLNIKKETAKWQDIINNMYFAFSIKHNVFLQQDNFLDKEIIAASKLNSTQRPINQHWSWDRILRSCYIKQADTLQAFYLFEDEYDMETIKRHFDFYEPITVHESSLSPCIHSILAAKHGYMQKAYEMYLRTSRLDLDDYNREVAEGCHITSMGGTWMSIVYGFAGFRVKNGKVYINPQIPTQWKSYSFHIVFRQNLLLIKISKEKIEIQNIKGYDLEIIIKNINYNIKANTFINI